MALDTMKGFLNGDQFHPDSSMVDEKNDWLVKLKFMKLLS